jgi:hypothetical protein
MEEDADNLLEQLWAQHEEVARSGAAPLLRDLELAGRLVELALAIPDAGHRIRAVALAAHAVDAVIERLRCLDVPEPLRQPIDQVAAALQAKLEGARDADTSRV